MANKFRKPEALIIRQRQTHGNNINNKVPFQRRDSMCLPVAGATKNRPGMAWRGWRGNGRFQDLVPGAGCGPPLCYSTFREEGQEGYVQAAFLKNAGKVGHA